MPDSIIRRRRQGLPLIGLEHEFDPATEFFLILHQQLGRAQQHGGMDIVATGVGRAGFWLLKGGRSPHPWAGHPYPPAAG